MSSPSIPAINFHIWKYCNFKCKFCFATYDDNLSLYHKKSHLSEDEMIKIIEEIRGHNIEKITFAGGEPMLCKWLPKLIKRAKELGMTTMIVTNGFLLSDEWIESVCDSLDWITLSIDSIENETQLRIGRSNKGSVISPQEYFEKVYTMKKLGIRFKLNTVVSSSNKLEDMSEFVLSIKPERWKIFQVLPMTGQNDENIDDFIISESEYQNYLNRHDWIKNHGIDIVPENNDLMVGSYLMIDPLGRLYDNINGYYHYSEPILNVGFIEARKQITVYSDKFINRKGLYDW